MKKILLATLLSIISSAASAQFVMQPYFMEHVMKFKAEGSDSIKTTGVYMEVVTAGNEVIDNYGLTVTPTVMKETFSHCHAWVDLGDTYFTGTEIVPVLSILTGDAVKGKLYPSESLNFYIDCPLEEIKEVTFYTSVGSMPMVLKQQ